MGVLLWRVRKTGGDVKEWKTRNPSGTAVKTDDKAMGVTTGTDSCGQAEEPGASKNRQAKVSNGPLHRCKGCQEHQQGNRLIQYLSAHALGPDCVPSPDPTTNCA